MQGEYAKGYGAVLDSGTTFTYLPTAAFNAFLELLNEALQGKGVHRSSGADPEVWLLVGDCHAGLTIIHRTDADLCVQPERCMTQRCGWRLVGDCGAALRPFFQICAGLVWCVPPSWDGKWVVSELLLTCLARASIPCVLGYVEATATACTGAETRVQGCGCWLDSSARANIV
jgi:hypothetical protein